MNYNDQYPSHIINDPITFIVNFSPNTEMKNCVMLRFSSARSFNLFMSRKCLAGYRHKIK